MPPTDHRSPSFSLKVPEGDDRERFVCTRCSFIDYQNPRVVVGSVATDDQGRILLCRRAIEPQAGLWTLPAGYLEVNEAPEKGAMREAQEEAGAVINVERLLSIYTIVRISQIQLIYRARLANPDDIAPGVESLELKLVPFADIPWAELAFPSVVWALRHWKEMQEKSVFAPLTNPSEGL